MRRKWIVVSLAAATAVALVAGALVFKPWLLFVDVEVNDALPVVEQTPSSSALPEPDASTSPQPPEGPVQLSSGDLISHEHETTGVARVIENPDGSRVLAIENLATSNGPDVHVWLSSAPVVAGADGWFLAGDAAFIDLGPIKGNLGDQLYEIPAGVDLAAYPSVYLWCVQFSVSFGAAALV